MARSLFRIDSQTDPRRDSFGAYVRDILSDALAQVILTVLAALAVVIAVSFFFGISFFSALGLLAVLAVGGWAFHTFSDFF